MGATDIMLGIALCVGFCLLVGGATGGFDARDA